MSATLKIVSIQNEHGRVVVTLGDDAGATFQLPLSVLQVATLVSGLHSAQDKAMKEPVERAPDAMLPMVGISAGGTEDLEVLRVYLSDDFYQDYCAKKGEPAAEMIRALSVAWAKASGQKPTPWWPDGQTH